MSWHFTHQSPILAFNLTYCRSQPPALRATSFQRKEGKQLERVTIMEPIEPSNPAAPVKSYIKLDMTCTAFCFISYSLSHLR